MAEHLHLPHQGQQLFPATKSRMHTFLRSFPPHRTMHNVFASSDPPRHMRLQHWTQLQVATMHSLTTLQYSNTSAKQGNGLHRPSQHPKHTSKDIESFSEDQALLKQLLGLVGDTVDHPQAQNINGHSSLRRNKQHQQMNGFHHEEMQSQIDEGALKAVLDEHKPDPKQLSRIVSALAKRGHLAPVLPLCQWSLKQPPPLQPTDCLLPTRVISMLSNRTSTCRQALQLYKEMRNMALQPDLVCYNAAISAAGRCGEIDAALSMWRELRRHPKIQPDVFTYTALITACGQAGNWDKAQSLFDMMQAKGVKPNLITYTSLMRALQRGGQHQAAIQLFQQLEVSGLKLDVVAYNTAMAAAAKAENWEKAWAVFNSMRHSSVTPTVVSYNTLISACERCGEVDRAMEAYQQLQRHAARSSIDSKQLQPNLVTYNTIISACGKAGRWRRVELLLDELLSLGFQPDAFTLSALLTACEKAGKGSEAPAVWQKLTEEHKVKPNSVAYNGLMNAVGSSGNWRQALNLLQRMQRDPRYKVDVVSYGCVIAACERGGQWALALELFEEMQDAGIRPNSYIFASLINACEQGEQWDKAIQLFKLMQEQSVPQQSVGMLVRRLAYSWPPLFAMLPSPLVKAAIATVKSGQAARRWVEQATAEKED